MLNEGDRIRVDESPKVECCFCGLWVSTGYLGDLAVVLHDTPMCQEFERMDASDFLNACIRKLHN